MDKKDKSLANDLASLLNEYNEESLSDTPDFILANFLLGCLRSFNAGINDRERWYDNEH